MGRTTTVLTTVLIHSVLTILLAVTAAAASPVIHHEGLCIVGKARKLTCTVRHAVTTPTSFPLTWSVNGQSLLGDRRSHDRHKGLFTSVYRFTVALTDHLKKYTCTADFGRFHSITGSSDSLTIHVDKEPDQPYILGTRLAIPRETSFYRCWVDGATRSYPTVSWTFTNGSHIGHDNVRTDHWYYLDKHNLTIYKVKSSFPLLIWSGEPSFSLKCTVRHELDTVSTYVTNAVFKVRPCARQFYGPSCSKTCGHCASSSPCNQTTGECFVCLPGWSGTPFCNKENPAAKGWNGRCGHCYGHQPCNNVTGYCKYCQTGRVPPLCQRGGHVDYVLTCPHLTPYRTSTLTGTVDTANFYTCSFQVVDRVLFEILHTRGHKEIICQVDYPACSKRYQSLGNGHRCRCVQRGDRYTYELDFYFNEAKYRGSALRISSNCLPFHYKFVYKQCEHLRA